MRRPIQKNPGQPVYLTLANLLEGMIKDRSLRVGDRMPSIRQFSKQQRVSIPTAFHAYMTLESSGVIEARPKSGFFVSARLAQLTPEPSSLSASSRVTDFANLDPLDSLLADLANPKLVPLGAAMPAASLLPGPKLARTMGAIARRLDHASTSYDMAPGSETVRRAIARRSLEWGCALHRDDIIITNGCTEAIALALLATCKPGDTVVVESPTYFGLARTLRELQFKALPIPVDSVTGIDLAALTKALKRTRVSACVLIPNFHNPAGFCMPDNHKKELVALLSKRGIPIIEDDIYGDLQHHGPRPRCLKTFDSDDSVLLCSSFSKTLAPGYRVGYIAPGRWHQRILRLKQSLSLATATMPSLAITEFLNNGGYDRHLRTIREAFRQQTGRMREAVAESFPQGVALSKPQGSFLLWCELPAKVDSLELFQRARRNGISIAPGPMFSPDAGYRNFIRLNCGHPWSPRIEEAVNKIGRLVHELAKG